MRLPVKRLLPIFALIALSAPMAAAQDWARERLTKSPRHQEWASVKHDGRTVETFIVYPEVKDKRPVVLIIHEIFGLTDWAQEVADEVAAAGYIAVAPDLLSGTAPAGGRTKDFAPGGATEAVSKLNPDQVTADLNAAADYGLKLPASNGKLYVAGFCWGGGQSFRFATNRPTSPPLSSSMALRRTRTRWPASRRPFMAFTPAMTPVSAPPFPIPSPT